MLRIKIKIDLSVMQNGKGNSKIVTFMFPLHFFPVKPGRLSFEVSGLGMSNMH